MMPTWDAELYLRFGSDRTRPAADLVARLSDLSPRRIIDLGCGPGNSTAVLRSRWPDAEIVGLDSSPAMIAAAKKDFPDGKWITADIATWPGDGTYDLVFSNATLQWVPHHAGVLPHLFAMVGPGGALAVQMPVFAWSKLHQMIAILSEQEPWRQRTARARGALRVEPADFYYNLLRPLVESIDLW